MDTYIWLGIAIISVIAEISTAGLTAIWFAPAALLSMVLSLFGIPVSVQIPTFIIVSGLLMLLFYGKIRDNIEKKSEKTNIDALIGKEAIAEEDISARQPGRVKVGGISWAAYIRNDSLPVKKGEFVKIIAIDGVKLEVEKIETEAEVLSNEYICDK